MATHDDPVALNSYLNVFKVNFAAGSSSTAQLIHSQISIPGSALGAIGGHGAGVTPLTDAHEH